MDMQKQVYREEAYELLSDLEEALLELEQRPEDKEIVGRVFRNMHTIKGSGAMFGFDRIAAFTHTIETVYDLIREGKLKVTGRLISLTLAACDRIRGMLEASEGGEDEGATGEILAGFQAFLGEEKAPQAQPKAAAPEEAARPEGPERMWRIRFRPNAELFANGTNPLPLLGELRELGQTRVVCSLDALPALEEMDPEACYAAWDIVMTTQAGENEIRDVFIFVEDLSTLELIPVEGEEDRKVGEILLERGDVDPQGLSRALAQQRRLGEVMVSEGIVTPSKVASALAEQEQVREQRTRQTQAQEASSVRVASSKLDSLVDLVGELVIVQARLSQAVSKKADPEMVAISEEVERLTAELRDNAMDIRMLPIGTTFARFKRLVRDLSGELGKKIAFTTEGAETELDKTVIEKLADPLVHLIRNSIDHGVETPEVRRERGKPEEGVIHLAAEHSGAYVLITIADDGKGLDAEAIRAQALQRGLIAPEAQLGDKELYELIFAPGFSTAETVTSVSGRGVGMDVVHRGIETLGGSVEIDSTPGAGTSITLKLPLTLAIIDGLLVTVAEDHYVLPLGAVLECVELTPEDIARTHGRRLARVRDEIVPYISLRETFSVAGEAPDIQQIVITETGERKTGFVVDRVIGSHQTVIKTLGRLLRDARGIAGATILGSGEVALILDINKLRQAAEIDEDNLVHDMA